MPEDRWLLSAEDLADRFGVAPSTIRRQTAAGKFPQPVRVGRRILWRSDEVRAWIREGCPPRSRWRWPKGNAV